MNENDVRIVGLEPMRVASAYAFGDSPEEAAFAKMRQFAESKGLLVDGQLPATFGFNNPSPSPGSPNYGYEVLLPISGDVTPESDIRLIDFPGGLYAVGPCEGVQNIGRDWTDLAKWREGTAYAAGKHQWLEHLLSPPDTPPEKLKFDLYLPIAG